MPLVTAMNADCIELCVVGVEGELQIFKFLFPHNPFDEKLNLLEPSILFVKWKSIQSHGIK